MSKTRANLLSTSAGQVVGKSQGYALSVDANGDAVPDALGNEQLEELRVIGGRLQTDALDKDAGTGGTGIVIPVGGTGKLGWLSGIYDRLSKVVLAAGGAVIGKVGIDQTAGENVISFGAVAQPVSIVGSLANIPVEIQACKPEVSSSQDSQIATTAKTYARTEGASQIEVYVESGYARVRTDGQPCTSTTGEPIASGFGSAWKTGSISIFYVQESIVTVVSR